MSDLVTRGRLTPAAHGLADGMMKASASDANVMLAVLEAAVWIISAQTLGPDGDVEGELETFKERVRVSEAYMRKSEAEAGRGYIQ